MATLTEMAYYFRRILKVGGISLMALLVIRIVWGIGKAYLIVAKPSPPPPPTVTFGKLPSIVFPEKIHPELTLRLETPTGGTPDLGDRGEVLLMPTYRSRFLALEEAKVTTAKMGFKSEPKEITGRRYRWSNEEFLPSTLEMDTVNGSFLLKRNWQADPGFLTEKQLSGKEQAMVEAENFLRQAGLLTEEMQEAETEVSYLTFSAGQYMKAVSLSEADFVQVDMFRPKIEEYPVLPSDPEKGVVRIIFSGDPEPQKRIVQVEYNYFPVDEEQKATYPIKTAGQAWRELQTKKGYVAATGETTDGVVTIRRIYLGYYDPDVPKGFLQPIIVFEGDKGFYGYVAAITDEWLEIETAIGD